MGSSALIPFAAGLALAAIHDVRHRRIPNAFVLTFLLGGLFVRLLLGGGSELGQGLLGLLLGGALFLLPFHFRVIGGGDVKLMAAVGAWLGVRGVAYAAIAGLIAGALLAIAMLLRDRALRREVFGSLIGAMAMKRLPEPYRRVDRMTLPYGAALAAGALFAALFCGELPHA